MEAEEKPLGRFCSSSLLFLARLQQLAALSREMRQRLWAHQELQRPREEKHVAKLLLRLSSLASNDELLAKAEELRGLAYEAQVADVVQALLSRHEGYRERFSAEVVPRFAPWSCWLQVCGVRRRRWRPGRRKRHCRSRSGSKI